nr:50S ribosomal protein L35 [Anaerolineae bacterium]
MPKIKTHKSTSKRFRRTKGGKGKLMRTKLGKSHLRRKKSRRVRGMFDEMHEVESKGIRRRVRRLAPYLSEKGK